MAASSERATGRWVARLGAIAAPALTAGAAVANVLLALAGPAAAGLWLRLLWQAAWREPLFRMGVPAALALGAALSLGRVRTVRRAAPVVAAIAGAAAANVAVAALGAGILLSPALALPAAAAIALALALWSVPPLRRRAAAWRRRALAEGQALWRAAAPLRAAAWRARRTILALAAAWLGLRLGLAALHLAAPAAIPAGSAWLELTALYLAAAVWRRWPSRVAAGTAVGALALCPLAQLWLGEAAAEQLADFVYLALWIAVVQGMWELRRERRQEALTPSPPPSAIPHPPAPSPTRGEGRPSPLAASPGAGPHPLAASPGAGPHPLAPSPPMGEGELAHHDRGQQAPLALDGSGAAWRSRTGPGEEGSVRPRQSRGGEGVPAPLSPRGRGAGGEGVPAPLSPRGRGAGGEGRRWERGRG